MGSVFVVAVTRRLILLSCVGPKREAAGSRRKDGPGDTLGAMADTPKRYTVEELEQMTPAERQAAGQGRVITDFDELPPVFRDRVLAPPRRLGREWSTGSDT